MWPSYTIWQHRSGSTLDQCNGLLPDSNCQQAITWTNVHLSSIGFSDIDLMAVSQEICELDLKIFNLYSDVIRGVMVSQITSLTVVVYPTVYSGTDQRKHQSSASLAFVRGIHRWPVNSLHKWPVMQKIFPFDNIMHFITVITDNYPRLISSNDILMWYILLYWVDLLNVDCDVFSHSFYTERTLGPAYMGHLPLYVGSENNGLHTINITFFVTCSRLAVTYHTCTLSF